MKQISLLATIIYIPFVFLPIIYTSEISSYIKISSILVCFLLIMNAGLYLHKYLKHRKRYMTLPKSIEELSPESQQLYRDVIRELTKGCEECD